MDSQCPRSTFSAVCDLPYLTTSGMFPSKNCFLCTHDSTSLSRTILYPRLEDHDSVSLYPPVSGMQKDIFFFSHMHAEDGAEDSVSKTNTFEVVPA